jgi:virginiamycin A acetyltransferase
VATVITAPEVVDSPAIPDPDRLYPDVYGPKFGRVLGDPQVVFLKPLVQSPFTIVGDYTYYRDARDPLGFERNCVLFHHGPERLVIGRYTQLASGVRFIMNSANHRRNAISTYPFPLFGGQWLEQMPLFADRPFAPDTVVGNDVWIGTDVVIMPGVTIGDGAIVAATSTVTSDVAPYTVVGGNPARPIRERFAPDVVERLLRVAWWDREPATITRHLAAIMSADLDALERGLAEESR